MVVRFDIVPVAVGPSLSQYLAEIIDIVDNSGLSYQLTSMGTIVEGDWDDVFSLIKRCHEIMLNHSGRVLTNVSIDDRTGYGDRITGKVESVERKIGRKIKK